MTARNGGTSASPENSKALYSINLEVLGERIRRARLEKKISQRDLSSGLFTSAYLSSLELGKTRPTYHTLTNLAERLDKSLDYFLRQTSGMAGEMDEEQARIMEIRLALLMAQTAIERAADERAEKALQQVNLHLARLTNAEKARYYYLRARFYNLRNEPVDAITELEEAHKYLQDGYDRELEILIENEKGNAHYLQRRIMPALTHYSAGLEMINTAKESFTTNLKWKLLMNTANCYLLLNDWSQAIGAFREALEQAGSTLDPVSQAELFYGIAAAYGELGDFQRACLNMGRSLQIYEDLQDKLCLIRTHNALGQMQAQSGQFENAENQVNAALRLAQVSNMTDRCQELSALVTMAIIRQKQNSLPDAQKYIEQALKLQNDCTDGFYLGRLYRTAGEIQADIGNREKSTQFYHRAIEIIEPSNLANSLADIYHSYGQRLRGWGEVDKAFEYMEKAYRQRELGRAANEMDRNAAFTAVPAQETA